MKKLLLVALLLTLTLLLFGEQYTINGNQNEVNVISSGSQETVLEMTLGHFNRESVRINGDVYWALNLKKEGFTMETGMPQLPYISRSLIIPGTALMNVQILESEYTDVVMPIAPSKGNLTRDINPDTVPWTFDNFYQSNGYYPTSLSRLSEPFIIRDYRGITVYMQPFVYYPSTQTLRIYTRIKLSVNNNGIDNVNVMSSAKSSASAWFENIYKSMFLNYEQTKYPVLDEEGRILIITNSMFNTTLQPYLNWKRQKGFTVNVVDITTAGPTATQLKTYIQNQYDLNNNLAFVQIIGDHAQVPSLTSGGGASDPSFALLAGGDNYPDIFVGRFSAQTTTDLETQVTRSIAYERDMQSGNNWLATGMGIASNQGGGSQGDLGESDQVHIENIRTDLMTYGYTTVDQVYEALGATQAMISNGVNAGRGMINYCGHGSNTSWGTTGFSNTQVNQLTNDNKLPFIVSVACVNGNFTNITCFAEAWTRAIDSVTGNPRGALVFYGSSINQSWDPPMRAQDEIVDLMVANQKNTIGGLFFNGSSKMIEVYGADGSNMYKTWHIFGDASLQVRTAEPQPMTAQYNDILFMGLDTFAVQTNPGARVTLSYNSEVYGTAIADASGNANITLSIVPAEPMVLTITITAFDRITHIGTVQVVPNQGPYVQVDNQIITDGNNNLAEPGETIYFDLALINSGNALANNIVATISSNDPFISIADNMNSFGDIPADSIVTSTNGFAINIANNAPDQHIAIIHVVITLDGIVEWEYNVNIILNAPAFTVDSVIINDNSGNSNGRIDAGETFMLTIPVTNSGHSPASDVLFSLLITNNVNYILTPVMNNVALLAVGETVQVMFEITFSSQVPVGTQAQFILMGVSGQYSINYSFSSYISLVMESFDSGDMTGFPWTFAGGDWTLDYSIYYSSTASAKSAAITNSQSTSMYVQMDIPANGTISFWKKVSSEANYDFLKFYINGTLKNSWSGEVNWGQESYPVLAGNNVFKWEYIKDYVQSAGSDCAWIDDINFPSTGGTVGTPEISFNETSIDFGSHLDGDFTPYLFTITNNGDATMIGTLSGNDIFQVKPASEIDYDTTVNYIIPAGLTMNFNVMVFPPSEGTYNTNLVVTSDDPLNPVSNINVTAIVLPVANDDNHTALVTILKGIYPNPFNPETTISFSIKQDSKVSVDIYNLLGQKVKTLVSTDLKAGNHSYKWNGRDDNGRSVGSGIYFCRMNTANYSATSKMVLMK